MTRKIEDPKPGYLETGDIDVVMRLNTNLMSEIWILRDRLAIMERLLNEKSILAPREIDAFVPDAAMEAELEKLRAQFVERAIKSGSTKGYTVQSLVESVGEP